MKNTSGNRSRYAISPSHQLSGQLPIKAAMFLDHAVPDRVGKPEMRSAWSPWRLRPDDGNSEVILPVGRNRSALCCQLREKVRFEELTRF